MYGKKESKEGIGKAGLVIRLYPNRKQEALLNRVCLDRLHQYKALALWWNVSNQVRRAKCAEFFSKEENEEKRKAYKRTLPNPPLPYPIPFPTNAKSRSDTHPVSPIAFNSPHLHVIRDLMPSWMHFAFVPDKDGGELFDVKKYIQHVFGDSVSSCEVLGYCKEDFARSINSTFSEINYNRCVKNKKPWPPVKIHTPKLKDANTFSLRLTGRTSQKFQVKRSSSGRVHKVWVPFLSGDLRKKFSKDPKYGKDFEWVDCALSEKQLEKCSNATKMTVKKNGAGQWTASVLFEKPLEEHVETGLECGIDLGLKTTAVLSENMVGETSTEYDKYRQEQLPVDEIMKLEKKIDYLRKVQSRRIKTWLRLHKDDEANGLKLNTDKNDKAHNAVAVYCKKYKSNAYKATEQRIAKLSNDIANIRTDFAEKFSRKVADRYDVVGLEDLNVNGMVKNKKMSRNLERIGFYKLRVAIERKVKTQLLDTFAPSSQTCSRCGFKNKAVKDCSVREWTCPQCGHHHDRDENAASNIRPSSQGLCMQYVPKKADKEVSKKRTRKTNKSV